MLHFFVVARVWAAAVGDSGQVIGDNNARFLRESVVLYLDLMTTEGCHLCDEAVAVLQQVLVVGEAEVDLVDIVYDPELMNLYAERIPVLVQRGGGHELGWPFDGDQLRQFLDTLPQLPSPQGC